MCLKWWRDYIRLLDYGLWVKEFDGGQEAYLYNRANIAFIKLVSKIYYPRGWQSMRGYVANNHLYRDMSMDEPD